MPDTPDEGVQDDGAGDDTQPQTYVGTYKSREEAEKGLREKEKFISQLQSERDKAKSDGAKLHDILEKLTEKVTRKDESPEPDSDEVIQKVVDDLAEKLENDPKAAARQFLEIQNSYLSQSEQNQAKARDEAVKAIADQLGMKVSTLEKKLAEADPETKAYRETARKLAEAAGEDFDANPSMFLKIAKATSGTQYPERPDLPGGSETTRMAGGSDGVVLDDETKAAIGWDDLTPKQKKELQSKWRAGK